jgi:7-keto-8-aminopelargonate synthetase-like enzyme
MRGIAETRLSLASVQRSPIFQAQCDSPRFAFAVAERMKARGFYCCVCVFPAVPMNRPGLRFTMTRHNQPDDIVGFLSALDETFEEVRSEVLRGNHGRVRPVQEEPDASFDGIG